MERPTGIKAAVLERRRSGARRTKSNLVVKGGSLSESSALQTAALALRKSARSAGLTRSETPSTWVIGSERAGASKSKR